MKRTNITIQDLEKAIQSLKREPEINIKSFKEGMYYARDLMEPYYNKLLKENERLNNIINTIVKMFDSDEHFEDGCYCYEIEKYVRELKGSDKDE